MENSSLHFDFNFETDGENLVGTIIKPLPQTTIKANILSLHGAGDAVRQRAFYAADHFARQRFMTTAFDMSGHGESSGTMKESTLKRRHDQALAVAHQAEVLPTVVMGNSMGGFVATTLLPDLPLRALILICPALYASAAYDVAFDSSFTEILRRPGSYRDAHTLDYLRSFKGSVLLLIGQNDTVIPAEVMEIYQNACVNARDVQYSVIPNAPHRIHMWAVENPANSHAVLSEIDRFLNKVFV